MASFTDFQDGYERTWASLQIRPEKLATVRELAQQLAAGKLRYREIEARTGVPWWFVGLCHYRESAFDFDTYLGNGQTLGRRTTIVPKGRGPFTGPQAFVEGAVDALRLQGLIGVGDWSVARALYRLEGFNGYGYHGRGVNSPYLWGGSTAYGPPGARGGKFVRDHVFDPNVVDTQIGTAVILRSLIDIDATVALAAPRAVEAAVSREPDDELADSTLWVQQSLNRLGAAPPLVEDGRNGPRTMAAVAMFQERCGLDDSGLADARTIAAIQEALRPAPDRAVLARIQDLERQVAARAASPTQTAPLQPVPMHPAVIAPAAPVPAAPPRMPRHGWTSFSRPCAGRSTARACRPPRSCPARRQRVPPARSSGRSTAPSGRRSGSCSPARSRRSVSSARSSRRSCPRCRPAQVWARCSPSSRPPSG